MFSLLDSPKQPKEAITLTEEADQKLQYRLFRRKYLLLALYLKKLAYKLVTKEINYAKN